MKAATNRCFLKGDYLQLFCIPSSANFLLILLCLHDYYEIISITFQQTFTCLNSTIDAGKNYLGVVAFTLDLIMNLDSKSGQRYRLEIVNLEWKLSYRKVKLQINIPILNKVTKKGVKYVQS